MTIRRRVTLATFAVLAAVLAVAGALVDESVARTAARALDEHVAADAASIAALTKFEGRSIKLDFDEEGDPPTPFSAPRCGAYFEAATARGVLARSRSLGDAHLAPPEPADLAPLGPDERRARWTTTAGPFEPSVRVLALEFAVVEADDDAPRDERARAPRTVVVLRVARTLAEVEAARSAVRIALGVALPLALLLGTGGAFLVARRATDPMIRLGDEAAAIGADRLDARLDLARVDGELRALALALNGAFDRLAAAVERERRFAADAAHELRTPLAVSGSTIDLALSRERDAEEYRAALVEAREGNARLERLVASLLLLTRTDPSALARERLDLRAVALVVVETLRPIASAAKVALELVAVDAEVPVNADAALLERLVSNLVENAVRHGGAGGRVEVVVEGTAREAVVSVLDRGPWISPELSPRLFERFARGDPARARATGGTGLGLAIVRAIARAHGGEAKGGPREGGGAAFEVRLPLA